MAKTRRLIGENLKQVDVVLELLDARIPAASRNPEIAGLVGNKPLLTLLNKCSLADPAVTARWLGAMKSDTGASLAIDCITGEGFGAIAPAVRALLAEKIARYAEKGMQNRRLRAMVVGIPNVGKSSLINRLCGTKKAKVENRPGVTLAPQWVSTRAGLDLMDMPGVLWPKFEDRRTGENLAVTGAIKDDVVEIEALAAALCGILRVRYPALLTARYKLDEASIAPLSDYELLAAIGKKRGLLVSGGEIDAERTAKLLLDEFRAGKIGRISLEMP